MNDCELLYVCPSKVSRDVWNSRRKSAVPARDKELLDSVRIDGVLEPPVIARNSAPDGRPYIVVCGTRRLWAHETAHGDAPIQCVLRPLPDGVEGEYARRRLNLIENCAREDSLLPWERAEALLETKELLVSNSLPVDTAELASAASISRSYCENLIRAVERLLPELWSLYKRTNKLTINDIIAISASAPEEQGRHWNKLIEKRARRGRARPSTVSYGVIAKLRDAIPYIRGHESAQWRAGASEALSLLLRGERRWDDGSPPLI